MPDTDETYMTDTRIAYELYCSKALNAELLAALKACIPILQKVDYYEGVDDIFIQARAVIAKTRELDQ